ncbi:hypothetical protein [Kitasatospora purpeofusca]|nr:hypothetical protein [Kitasatospora purpeofusca]
MSRGPMPRLPSVRRARPLVAAGPSYSAQHPLLGSGARVSSYR